MAAFRARRLDHVEFPYLFADATYVKGRVGGQVVSRAVFVVIGVTTNGEREVLGCAVARPTAVVWDCPCPLHGAYRYAAEVDLDRT